MSTLSIEAIKPSSGRKPDPNRKSEFGQYMTPAAIGRYMASLFRPAVKTIRLLDAGAGAGSLTAAFLDRFHNRPVALDAWEVDPDLQGELSNILATYACRDRNLTVHRADFIEDAVWNLSMAAGPRFTHAILNPPYKKIGSHSRHRLLLREAGIETVNLYTAFLALAILSMEQGGEIVAIVPRSFCNGLYYRPFRELLTKECAIRHIHVFEARNKAFSADDVLQENIVINLERGGTQGEVVTSESHDASFADYRTKSVPFGQIIKTNDPELFIHIPSLDSTVQVESPLFRHNLDEIGLQVCTGPVVDFRMRDHCRAEPEAGAVPLLYTHHFASGELTYPRTHKKPNAIRVNEATLSWLMPQGFYVLTKRFTSKEERRRIVAFTLDPDTLPAPLYGFENHLNVFHTAKHGIDMETARGLTLFLNSTLIDNHFRQFSGHTQVNATDLRQMRYPSREQLRAFGRYATGRQLTQAEIDDCIATAEREHG